MSSMPEVHVHLPAALCDLFPGSQRHIDVQAVDVKGVIDALDRLWPGMGDRLRDSTPAVRKHISVMVNGERLTLNRTLQPRDDVWILTAISGG